MERGSKEIVFVLDSSAGTGVTSPTKVLTHFPEHIELKVWSVFDTSNSPVSCIVLQFTN